MYIKSYFEFINESNNKIYDSRFIIDYIKDISDNPETDVPDYYFTLIKKANAKFKKETIDIKDLLKKDKSLKEYVDSKEDRYEDSEYQPYDDELDNPIVIFKGEVIDGYNRTSTKFHKGEKAIEAYASI